MFRTAAAPIALSATLALSACDGVGHTTLVTRTTIDGADTVHVVTDVAKDVARFHCLSSRSGRCRIVVYTRHCEYALAAGSGRLGETCTTQALARLEVDTGATRELHGLPTALRQCASDEATPNLASCLN
jgi:hypothetical protein